MSTVRQKTDPLFYQQVATLYARYVKSRDEKQKFRARRLFDSFLGGDPTVYFLDRCETRFSLSYPQGPAFSSSRLLKSLCAALILRAHETDAFEHRGTMQTRALSARDQARHCMTVALRVEKLIKDISFFCCLDCPSYQSIHEATKKQLSSLYLQEARRLARRLAEKHPVAVIQQELQGRCFFVTASWIEEVISTELSLGSPPQFDEDTMTSSDFLEQRVWERCRAVLGGNTGKMQEDQTGAFLTACKQDFTARFPSIPFPEEEVVTRYVRMFAQMQISSERFKFTRYQRLTGRLNTAVEQVATECLIAEAVQRDFGISLPDVRKRVDRLSQESYWEVICDQGPMLILGEIVSNRQSKPWWDWMSTYVPQVMNQLRTNFPMRQLWTTRNRRNLEYRLTLRCASLMAAAVIEEALSRRTLPSESISQQTEEEIAQRIVNTLLQTCPSDLARDKRFQTDLHAVVKEQFPKVYLLLLKTEHIERMQLEAEEKQACQQIRLH